MFRIAVPIAFSLCLAGCVVESAGPTRYDYSVIERDKSEVVRVNLNMGAGNLKVGSGTEKLMRADFAYNVPSWKPEVRYSGSAGYGTLTVSQPEGSHGRIGSTKYEWDLRLNREVPLEMQVHFGAGEANLALGGLSLRSVAVDMGVGKLDLDLRGTPKRSYDVRIRGGVGEATVRLPADVGVDAVAEGGIGEIRAPGMRREGRRYYNQAYDEAKTRIHLDVHGGIGSIRLISD